MTKRKIPQRLQRLISERAHFCCEYCLSQEAFSPDPFSNEHIIPEVLGGSSAEDNLVGLTPTGRASIVELRLNRENVVNLRRVLVLTDNHTPAHRLSSH